MIFGKDCFYVPNFKRNPISIGCLIKYSYLVSFNKIVVIFKNKSFLCSSWMDDNLYFIKLKMHSLLDIELIDNSKRLKKFHSNKVYL